MPLKQTFIIEFANSKPQAELLTQLEEVGMLAQKYNNTVLCWGFQVQQRLAELLTELFFGRWQAELLGQLTAERYDYFTEKEQHNLVQKTIELAQKDTFCWGLFAGQGKEQRLSKTIAEHLLYKQRLHWEGFGRFCLVGYEEYLCSLLSIAAEEIVLEQENCDYLAILKDFLAHQQPGGEVHVFFFRQGMYDICAATPEGLLFLEGGRLVGYEDMLVFSLLYLAPQKLLLHIEKPLPQILDTLLADLFGSKLQVDILKAGRLQEKSPNIYH